MAAPPVTLVRTPRCALIRVQLRYLFLNLVKKPNDPLTMYVFFQVGDTSLTPSCTEIPSRNEPFAMAKKNCALTVTTFRTEEGKNLVKPLNFLFTSTAS
jgi:hypothetical protein